MHTQKADHLGERMLNIETSFDEALAVPKMDEVIERLVALEASTASLSQDQDADWLESVLQRFQSVESSIAALAHSVQTQKPDKLAQRVRHIEKSLSEWEEPSIELPSWLEDVPERFESIEAALATLARTEDSPRVGTELLSPREDTGCLVRNPPPKCFMCEWSNGRQHFEK